MSHDQPVAKLVAMANQIALFFGSQRRRDSGEAVAEHLRKFWTPLMREQIRAYLDSGGAGLNDVARRGVERVDEVRRPVPAGRDDDSSEHARPAGV